MTLIPGFVLLIQIPWLVASGISIRFSHAFCHVAAFWLLAACGLPAAGLLLRDLVECLRQGLVERFSDSGASLRYPGLTAVITAVISPSKLCLTCVRKTNRTAKPEALVPLCLQPGN